MQVGNGELVAALFVIPLVLKIYGHLFEIYTQVSEIQQSMDLILSVNNMFEMEGEVCCQTSQFKFLNRSLYHYIDLSESDLTQREKDEVMDLVIAH